MANGFVSTMKGNHRQPGHAPPAPPHHHPETASAHHGQPGHALHLGILPLPPARGRRTALHFPPRRQPHHHRGRQNKILYTTDGSEPKAGSPVYSQGAKFTKCGTVKARCQFSNGKLGPVSQAKFGISKTGWKVKTATSGNAAAAIDDNPETSWLAKAEAPQSFVVDMGKPYQVSSFSYLPRQDGKPPA